ncbi:MAG: hypothetical protein WC554_07695 [Clostridia bacterium]|jgi:hypothetical protein
MSLKSAKTDYKKAVDTSKPGEGKRFEALMKVAKAGGASNPAAVAAAVGRKKYGKKRFAEMSSKGKKNK